MLCPWRPFLSQGKPHSQAQGHPDGRTLNYSIASSSAGRGTPEIRSWRRAYHHLNPQHHLPRDVEVGLGFGLGVADLVVDLEQQGSGQQVERHAFHAVVGAVEVSVRSASRNIRPRRDANRP